MSKSVRELPQGVCAAMEAWREQEGEVVFSFRGETYRALLGKNAVGDLGELSEDFLGQKGAEFGGKRYATPVVLFPAGEFHVMKRKQFFSLPLKNGLTVLGEQYGVSPNAPGDLRKPNPARKGGESVLTGTFYGGRFDITEDSRGLLTLDGLTLSNGSVRDYRSGGDGFTVENCIIRGESDRHIFATMATIEPRRRPKITVRDCRVDAGLDSVDAAGQLFKTDSAEITVERLYFGGTKKFFGLTDYYRQRPSISPGGKLDLTLRKCVFENGNWVHGLSTLVPADASLNITAEDCEFVHIAPAGDPVFSVSLPNKKSSLMLRRCRLEGAGETAIRYYDTKKPNVELADVRVEGYDAVCAGEPTVRTKAPKTIGKVVWEALDDPHEPCKDCDEALERLRLLYDGRSARFGDMHVHTNSGGKSDGHTPLREFVRQLKALGLDFAAVVDHKQIRHALLPEWDEDLLIAGTEPGTRIKNQGRPSRAEQMHYTMLFRRPEDYYLVMEAFPEFQYTGGTDGFNLYPQFSPERFCDLVEFIYSLGGVVAHAHPKELMASDDPLDYYFGDHCAIETILGSAYSYVTLGDVKLWEQLLKKGKRVHTRGDSDTHHEAKDTALTSTYTLHRKASEVLEAVRDGDCAAGCIGVQMAINCARMGGHLAYRRGLKLAIRLGDYFRPGMREKTVYCLKVYTDKGLAYASEFDGTLPQELVLPVKKRTYYRVEVTDETRGAYICISNPIWLDG